MFDKVEGPTHHRVLGHGSVFCNPDHETHRIDIFCKALWPCLWVCEAHHVRNGDVNFVVGAVLCSVNNFSGAGVDYSWGACPLNSVARNAKNSWCKIEKKLIDELVSLY